MDTDSSQIVEITAEGITYLDKDGKRRFIDFAECSNNLLEWLPESIRERERSGGIKRVGQVSDSRPYIRFFDSQLTGIHFSGSDECKAFHEKLRDMGWFMFESVKATYIDSSQIQEITPAGLTWLDKNGKEWFIDFAACFNTFWKWEHSATMRMTLSTNGIKRVGELQYILIPSEGDKVASPYAVFYDSQATRIKFSRQDKYDEFHQMLRGMGWSLFELKN